MTACDQVQELLPLQSMGLLPAEEAAMCEAHLADCVRCRESRRPYDHLARLLPEGAPLVDPPSGLRDRLMSRIAETRSPFTVIPEAAGSSFQPTDVSGVALRILHREGDRTTCLYRMDPGTSYPAHRHAATEECWVLQGDLHFDGCTMTAGDYQRAEEGSVHPVQSTEKGCLLLIVGSTSDVRV